MIMKISTHPQFFSNFLSPIRIFLIAALMIVGFPNVFGQTVVVSPTSPWVVPAGVTSITVEVWGGGGGGGGSAVSSTEGAGGGGGGGAYSRSVLTVSATQSYTITYGAAGSAGAAGNNAGGPGGTTTVTGTGGTVSAAGGGGGGGAAANGSGTAGTAGATTGTGTIKFAGGAGRVGLGNNFSGHGGAGGGGAGSAAAGSQGTAAGAGGAGGTGSPNAAPYIGGTGGSQTATGGNNVGGAGSAPGGGGAGGSCWSTAKAGGAGATGQVVITYSVPCSGTPAPGNTISSIGASGCPNAAFTLSLQNATTGGGVTYQWQSSPDNIVAYSNISGATSSTYSTTLSSTAYYKCIVTCSGNSGTSNPLSVTGTITASCYCTPTYSISGPTDNVTNVQLGTLNDNAPANVSPYYFNRIGVQNAVPSLTAGASYTVSVTVGTDVDQFSGVWIDFNRDATLGTTEFFTTGVTAGSNGTASITFTVPSGAVTGTTLMRVRGGDDVQPLSSQACGASSSSYGEALDYYVNIVSACTPPTITTQPSGTAQANCTGTAYGALTVATSASSPTYQWYSNTTTATTGGTLLSGATSISYTPQNSTANTLYYYCIVTASSCPATSTVSGSYTTTGPISAIAATPAPTTGNTAVCYTGTGAVSSISWATVAGASTYDVYFGTANPPTTLVSAAQAGLSYSTGALSAATTYYWKVVPKSTACGNTTGTPTVWNFTTSTAPCYCTASSSTVNAVDIITKVVLTNSVAGTYTNTSTSNGTNNYDIYNNTPLPLYTSSTTNTVAITFGTDGTQASAAWIDFNRNGVYEASENIGLATSLAGGGATVTYTFTVPSGATAGLTRMRVRGGADAVSDYTTGGACTTTPYGETEDYLVDIQAACTPPTITTQPSGTAQAHCTGSAYSALTVATSASSPSYQWYSNTTAVNSGGALLGGATSSSYTPQSSTVNTLYYYCIVTAAACPATSSVSGSYTTSAIPTAAITPTPATGAGSVCYLGSGSVSSISWPAVSGATSYDVYFGTASTPPLVSTSQAGVSYSTGTLAASTTYYWKVVAKNSCGSASGSATWSFTTAAAPCYCSPSSFSSSTYVSNFTISGGIGNFNNSTGYSAGGYGNYTSTYSASQMTSSAVNYSVSIVGGSAGIAIWVDWNQNGVFTDAGERVYNSAAYLGTGTYTGSFTVPSGSTTGTTRMRVITDYDATSPSSCVAGSFGTGEAEDYGFTVVAPGPLLIATSLASFGTTCTNNTSGPNTFTLTGMSLSSANVTVGPFTGYSFSTSAGGTYTPSLTLTPSGGSLSQAVYVKFTPTSTTSFSGNIPVTGGGATTINVATTGSSAWGATASAGSPGCASVTLAGGYTGAVSASGSTSPQSNIMASPTTDAAQTEVPVTLAGAPSGAIITGVTITPQSYVYDVFDCIIFGDCTYDLCKYYNSYVKMQYWDGSGWVDIGSCNSSVSITTFNGSAVNGTIIKIRTVDIPGDGSDQIYTDLTNVVATYTYTPAQSYSWSDAVGATYTANNTAQNPSVDKSGLYTLAVTSGGCTSTITATATVQGGATNAALATSSVNGVTLVPACTESGWTYYANPATPNNWLFSVFKNGNTFTPAVNLTVNASPTETRNDGLKKASYTLDRYWNLTLSSGSISSSLPVSVRFFYDPADTVAMRAAAVSRASAYGLSNAKINGLEWFKTTAGNAFDPANNTYSDVPNKMLPSVAYGSLNNISYVEYQGLTSFSGGTAGMRLSPSGAALPVTLLYLTATPMDNSYIKLDWATASEINNRGFDIERSADGTHFDKIGWIDGHGSTNQLMEYNYNDRTVAPNNIYYYRLKQIDFDGISDYSNIVSGTIISKNGFVVEALRPNPANDKVTLQVVSLTDQNASVLVTDMLGREITTKEWQIAEGFNGTDIDLSAFAIGTYNVIIKTENQYFTKKLVVSR